MVATLPHTSVKGGEARTEARNQLTLRAAMVLAAAAMLVAMRGASGVPIDPDAARHAMNGVLIHDMIRDGGLANPLAYTRKFYSRLPSVSLPFHPPVFPAFEAALYGVFGVSYTVARFAIAICVAASVLLLYRLASELSGSCAFGLAASAIFHSLPLAQLLTGEVMLEYPSLVATLGALLLLTHSVARFGTVPNGIAFGVLTAVAIWTKQNAVFLSLVPVAVTVLLFWWRKPWMLRFFTAFLIIVPSSLVLWRLMKYAGATSHKRWTPKPVHEIVLNNAQFYGNVIVREFTIIGSAFLACAAIWFVWRQRSRHFDDSRTSVLTGWIFGASVVPLMMRPFDARYIFALLPALVIVALLACRAVALQLRWSPWVLAGIVFSTVLIGFTLRAPSRVEMSGFAQAAEHIASVAPKRVLICSTRNGSFTFALRALQPDHRTTVLRGDRLTSAMVEPTAFAAMLHRHGIEYVVLHDAPVVAEFDAIAASVPAELMVAKTIAVTGNIPDKGVISIYKHVHPSLGPVEDYQHPSRIVQNSLRYEHSETEP
jgi:hypothetical protein